MCVSDWYVLKILPRISSKKKTKQNENKTKQKQKNRFSFLSFLLLLISDREVVFKLSTRLDQAFSFLIAAFLTSPARSDPILSLFPRPSLKSSFESATLRIFRSSLCYFKCDSTVSSCMSFVLFPIVCIFFHVLIVS